MTDADLLGRGAQSIGEHGCWTTDALVDRALALELAYDARNGLAQGAFSAAQLGRGSARRSDLEVRGDRSWWIDDWSRIPALARYRAIVEGLRTALQQALFVSARWFEGHYALYPPGARYARHLDQHRGAPHRLFTCILYLSEQADGGGELVVHDAETDGVLLRVEPRVGRFACLASARMPHEVTPSRFDRLTLTGWLRGDAPVDPGH